MKIEHNTHGWAPDRTDPKWAERVEREAERITDQTERRYRKAEQRLARAIAKAEAVAARQDAVPTRRTRNLWAEVERRREELLSLQRLANQSPAGAQHRGKGSHRGVPSGGTL